MALVTAGYQLPNDTTTALTRANLNLIGVPTVIIQPGEIVDSMVHDVSGTKIASGTLPSSALNPALASKIGGIKNYLVNPSFEGVISSGTAITSYLNYCNGWYVV